MKKFSFILAALILAACGTTNNSSVKDGNKYVPYSQRDGKEAVVYFTRNLSAEGLIVAYEKVRGGLHRPGNYDGARQGLWEADYAGRNSAYKNDLATIIRLTRGNDEDICYISILKLIQL